MKTKDANSVAGTISRAPGRSQSQGARAAWSAGYGGPPSPLPVTSGSRRVELFGQRWCTWNEARRATSSPTLGPAKFLQRRERHRRI